MNGRKLHEYELHPEWPHIFRMRLNLLAQLAIAEASKQHKIDLTEGEQG